MAEYTGGNLYLRFGSTVLSGDFRSFSPEETIETVDASAGNDTFRTKLTTLKDGSASVSLVDQTGGTALWGALVPGMQGTLEWGPEGTAAGKPKHTAMAIVTSRSRDIPYDDIVVLNVEFALNSEVTDDTY